MSDHLLRWRCASGPHVPTTYAPVRCSRRLATNPQQSNGGSPRRRASGALLRHLQGPNRPIYTRAFGASRFLNRLQLPNHQTDF